VSDRPFDGRRPFTRAELSDPEVPVYRIDETLRYDRELGEVWALLDGKVREVMSLRAELVDRVLREAVIIELERLGYTVTPPEVTP